MVSTGAMLAVLAVSTQVVLEIEKRKSRFPIGVYFLGVVIKVVSTFSVKMQQLWSTKQLL